MAFNLWSLSEAEKSAGASDPQHRSETSDAFGYTIGLIAWALGASIFVAVKIVQDEMPPFTMSAARAGLTAVVMSPFLFIHWKASVEFFRHHGLHAMALGAIGLGITQGVMYQAIHVTSVINAGIVFALTPIITMIMARVLIGEDMRLLQYLGALIAFFGVIFTVTQGDVEKIVQLQFGTGSLLALLSAFLFAIYTVYMKKAHFTFKRAPLLAIMLVGGAVGTAPFAIWEHVQGLHDNLNEKGYLALLYCSLFAGGLLYILFNWAIDILGAGRAGVLVYSQPIFTAVFAWLLLGERLEWYHYAGAGIVALGVILVLRMRPKPKAP
ncbi:MAG: DMT family transporter [Pseudomonadota bacterium]